MVKPILDIREKKVICTDHWERLRKNECIREIKQLNEEYYKSDHEDQPAYCARFGCGKKLTLSENMHGRYCLECSGGGRIVGKWKPDNLESAINKLIVSKLK